MEVTCRQGTAITAHGAAAPPSDRPHSRASAFLIVQFDRVDQVEYLHLELDSRHAIEVRFVVDGGGARDNAPVLLAPAQPFDDGPAHAFAAAVEAAEEPARVQDFLTAQMERVRQRRAVAQRPARPCKCVAAVAPIPPAPASGTR